MIEAQTDKGKGEPRRAPAKPERIEDVEITPEADARFRAAIHAAVKSGPKHRTPRKRDGA